MDGKDKWIANRQSEEAEQQEKRHSYREAYLFFGLIVVLGIIGNIAFSIIGLKLTHIEKHNLGLTAGGFGTLGLILGIPAYLQPFLGGISDLYPILGYRRRSYWFLGHLTIAASLIGFTLLKTYTYYPALALLLLQGFGGLFAGVAFNAVMVRVGNRTGLFGSMQSVSQLVPTILAIAGTSHLAGYAAQYWSAHRCFVTALLLYLCSLPFVFLFPEKRAEVHKMTEEEKLEHQRKHILQNQNTKAALKKAASTPGLWAIVAFVFYLILTPSPPTYFYQRNGLHFSLQFIGNLGIWSSSGILIGLGLFTILSRYLPVWSLVWGAYLMDCIGYIFNFYMLGPRSAEMVTLFGAIIGIIYSLMLYTLAARATPKGIEGTVYGLVLSAIALGSALGTKIGYNIYDMFGGLNAANHSAILQGWRWSNGFGFVFTVIAIVFIPFLPKWTHSRSLLKDTTQMENGA